jgi:hypothetical protein
MSREPAWHFQAIHAVIAILLIGAVAWEWGATSQLNDRKNENLARAVLPGTDSCDRVALALNLNQYQNNIVSVQWRRGLISGVIILLLLQVFANVVLSNRQTIVVLLLTWVVYTSVAGFSDYHMRQPASDVVDQCISIAIPNIASDTNTGDGSGACSADVYQPI